MLVGQAAVQGDIKAHVTGSIDFRLDFVRWRRDGELARAVVSALERSPMVPEGKIWVAVRDGQVTLRGQVDSDCQRAAAVALAHCLTGVRSVVDSITVAALVSPEP